MTTEHVELAIVLAGALTGSELLALLPTRSNSWVQLIVAIIQDAAEGVRRRRNRNRNR